MIPFAFIIIRIVIKTACVKIEYFRSKLLKFQDIKGKHFLCTSCAELSPLQQKFCIKPWPLCLNKTVGSILLGYCYWYTCALTPEPHPQLQIQHSICRIAARGSLGSWNHLVIREQHSKYQTRIS